ncbi:MAG: hypothetical protein K2O78_00185 [Muribaculaceae bacterium]|nr:hypothetical protein [Muribaculaceae bacterium]
MPWGASNRMPFEVLDRIEADETMSACMEFQSEVFYGAGLQFDTSAEKSAQSRRQAEEFADDSDLSSFWLGIGEDLKHFAFAVALLTLNADGSRIVALSRLEACYCRFAPAAPDGRIPAVCYANWRHPSLSADEIEVIPMLDPRRPFHDLTDRMKRHSADRRFALVVRMPKVDSTYYPIPTYASLFRSKWYDIKRLIAVAKEAKLRNSAPIKYHIQVSEKYFPRIFKAEGITDPAKQQLRVIEEKKRMVEFLTGAHNSGKAWFSISYVTPDGKTQSDVTITRIESAKEGGDWETDIQEAINMVCFALRVHSNLVGSVPGKSQSNNSGSDKRELYTIAQALQKPYRDLAFAVPRLICRYNGWRGVRPVCPFIQLTTLDEHADARSVDIP